MKFGHISSITQSKNKWSVVRQLGLIYKDVDCTLTKEFYGESRMDDEKIYNKKKRKSEKTRGLALPVKSYRTSIP